MGLGGRIYETEEASQLVLHRAPEPVAPTPVVVEAPKDPVHTAIGIVIGLVVAYLTHYFGWV